MSLRTVLSVSLLTCLLFPGSGSADDLDRKIGQMLMVGFRGLQLDAANPIVADIEQRNLGGVVLFDVDVPAGGGGAVRNIESPSQVASLNASLQVLAETPLLIAVDQEGGRIRRLKESHGFGPTVSHQALGEENDRAWTREKADDIARMLRTGWFNFNLAPVVDVNVNPESPAIGALERSFSADADDVVSHAFEYIAAHRNRGVLTALKHFPGHGSAEADSHLGFTDVTETWQPSELIPYEELIQAGVVDVVMTAHVFHAGFDSEHPATLSSNIIGGILRGQLGFEGVVISDDMQMEAISNHYSLEAALELSINAGVDLLVFANNSVFEADIAERAIGKIRDLVDQGKIPEARIHESHARIQALKAKIGLTPVERWRTQHFSETERDDPSVSGDEASAAGDGVPNLVKYFAGVDPRAFLSPETRVRVEREEEKPQLRFARWLAATDLTFSVDVSGDLADWESAEGDFARESLEGGIEYLRWKENEAEDDGDKRFYRLRLERTEP